MQDDRPLVTIATFDTGTEAMLAKGALEAIGIRALVPEEHLFRRGVEVAPGTLQVFQADEARARLELRRMQIRLVEPPAGAM